MASATAPAMFSGRIIFIFGIAERLRAFRYPIFTDKERNSNWQLPRWFPTETSARRGKLFRHRLRRCHLPQEFVSKPHL